MPINGIIGKVFNLPGNKCLLLTDEAIREDVEEGELERSKYLTNVDEL